MHVDIARVWSLTAVWSKKSQWSLYLFDFLTGLWITTSLIRQCQRSAHPHSSWYCCLYSVTILTTLITFSCRFYKTSQQTELSILWVFSCSYSFTLFLHHYVWWFVKMSRPILVFLLGITGKVHPSAFWSHCLATNGLFQVLEKFNHH